MLYDYILGFPSHLQTVSIYCQEKAEKFSNTTVYCYAVIITCAINFSRFRYCGYYPT